MEKTKLSIITITSNNDYLTRTLKSVLTQQTDFEIEHVIIDNLSSNTKQIVKDYIGKAKYKIIHIWEKDIGRYNAMNKGIKISNGEYLLFLNAGDHFYDDHSINKLLKNNTNSDIIFGNLNVITGITSNIYTPPDEIDFKYFLSSALPHQATIIKKIVFDKYGLYDENLKIVSDHNFFLKAICKLGCSYKHINDTISTYYFDGISSDSKNEKLIESEKNKVLDKDFSIIQKKIIKSKNKSNFNTPILFLLFNRPDTTQLVFNEIRKIKPKYLYISADGPRKNNNSDIIKCKKTREIIDQIDWNCKVHTVFREENFGCGNAMSKAITWFFSKVEKGIILEDDCIPSPSFFTFCEKMLIKYNNDKRITHVNGTSYVVKDSQDTYYFSKYYHVWGWATWKRAWINYSFNMPSYPKFKAENQIQNIFSNQVIQNFWISCFDMVHSHKIDTWDYQWVYANLVSGGVSIMPYVNLVSNIGFNNEATHTKDSNNISYKLPKFNIKKINNPKKVILNQKNDELIYEKILHLNIKQKSNNSNNFLSKLKLKIPDKILKVLFNTSILSVYATLLYFFIKHNINNPSFWFDESGQFWMAKGLNHYSPKLSQTGNIADVIQNNNLFNLDPGGFSILLHYWTTISNNYLFLRTLPLIFFLISMIIVVKIAKIWKSESRIVLLSGLVLLSSQLLSQYAFELRPYSMEMLTVFICLYFAHRIDYILRGKRHALISGLILGFLLTSRYSAVFSVITLSILIIIKFILKYRNKHSFTNLLVFSIPILISTVLIYLFTLRFQNPAGAVPFYVTDLMLNNQNINVLIHNNKVINILSPYFVLMVIFILSLLNKNVRGTFRRFYIFMYFSIILNLIIITLSLLGKYPWAVNTRWDITSHSLFIISWIPIFILLFENIRSKSFLLTTIIKISLTIYLLFFITNCAINFRYSSLDTTFTNLTRLSINQDSKILINTGAFPTTKYLFEYGPLNSTIDKKVYKNIQTFNHSTYTLNTSIPNINNINQFNYIKSF
jgi:hypothetical protein